MVRLLLASLCLFAGGALLAIPTCLMSAGRYHPLWGVPIALVIVAGFLAAVAVLRGVERIASETLPLSPALPYTKGASF